MALNLRALASKYRRWMLAFGIVIVLAILSIPIVQALATQSWSSATVLMDKSFKSGIIAVWRNEHSN
jgi:hypothetical protein